MGDKIIISDLGHIKEVIVITNDPFKCEVSATENGSIRRIILYENIRYINVDENEHISELACLDKIIDEADTPSQAKKGLMSLTKECANGVSFAFKMLQVPILKYCYPNLLSCTFVNKFKHKIVILWTEFKH